ncbi:hypothetical protein P2G85_07485 [Vibrio sp. CAU 1672]|nr:hypothetical protein [Vibrio sp. CAU 1672]
MLTTNSDSIDKIMAFLVTLTDPANLDLHSHASKDLPSSQTRSTMVECDTG